MITEKQMQVMMSQMQPHFIYNTLATIYYLCGKDAELAQKTLLDFTNYLRANMDSMGQGAMVPFEKELEHTKTYLSIELLRFSNILTVKYDIGCTDFSIPFLTVQPLVENAVKYGVRSRREGGCVTISTRRTEGRVIITVHDNGMGFDVMAKKEDGRSHIGIENTRRRIEALCGGTLTIESVLGEGTTVTITLEEKL